MAFADLVANLQLNTRPFSDALKQAKRQATATMSQMVTNTQKQTEAMIDLDNHYRRFNQRLHTIGASARDVSRIVSGILVSQAFYRGAEAIRSATDALWDFNEALDYAQITYSTLFGSTELASQFLTELQQFSVDTIFEFKDLEGMSRKLLAYGIEYENLMYTIQGLTNLGTLSGDSAALERLAVAIGQINAKGTLKAEEIRQLTNAYVPMYDILSEKLGVTEEGFKNIGDLGISAADAIDAIVEYSNEKFGDTAKAAMYTITGLNNRIVDSLKVMGADMLQPLTNAYKSFALFLSEQLNEIYEIYKNSGIGGVFEHLVPDELWQQRIREFVANVKNAVGVVAGLFMTLWPTISRVLGGFLAGINFVMSAFNALGSAVVAVLRTFGIHTPFVNVLTNALVAAAFAFALFIGRAIGAFALAGLRHVFIGIANAVVALTAAIARNPLVAGLILLGGVLSIVASRATGAENAISSLVNTLSSYSLDGTTADDVLQPTTNTDDTSDDLGDFWDSYNDAAEDAEENTNDVNDAAKKAAKSLLSFDEVFRLNEPTDSSSDNSGYDLSGLDDLTEGLSGLGGALIPEIPSFKEFAKNFVKSLYDDLYEALRTIASGAASGAIIGALIGFAIGGIVTQSFAGALAGAKIGAKIGTIVGAGFAGFWSDIYKEMEDSILKIAGGAATGALIGGLVGMVFGAFATKSLAGALAGAKLGAALGGIIGAGVGAIWAATSTHMDNAIKGFAAGMGIGALTGALVGLVLGSMATGTLAGGIGAAKIGAKIGAVVGAGVGGIFGYAEAGLKDAIKSFAAGMAVSTLVGALVGMVIGAFATRTPAGAVTGARIGAAVGAMIGASAEGVFATAGDSIKTSLSGMFKDVKAAGYGAFIGGLAGMIIGAIVGAFAGGIGALPGAKIGAVIGSSLGALGGMVVEYLNSAGIIESIGTWFGGMASAISSLWDSLWDIKTWKAAWTHVKGWFGTLKVKIGQWFTNRITDIKDWWSNLWAQSRWKAGWDEVTLWFSNLIAKVSGWFTERIADIKLWWGNLWDAQSWIAGWDKVLSWFASLHSDISSWFTTKKADVKAWWANLWITSTWSTGWSKVSEWYASLSDSISSWFTTKKEDVKTWWASLWITSAWSTGWSKVSGWYSSLSNSISSWFTTKKEEVKTWWANLWITSAWSTGWSKVSGWYKSLGDEISAWFTTKKTNVKTWWANLWITSAWSTGWSKVSGWYSSLKDSISSWFTNRKTNVKTWWANLWATSNWATGWSKVSGWYSSLKDSISSWFTNRKTNVKTWWSNLWDYTSWTSGWTKVKTWFNNLKTSIKSWFTSLKTSISTWWSNLWEGNTGTVRNENGGILGSLSFGHAEGGIFNREHIARFAEGNKTEAIIPLENNRAMQPFVDAVSNGLIQSLAPVLANNSGTAPNNGLPPMYVGTLVADDRGLKQLYKKFELIQVQENARRGIEPQGGIYGV